MSSELHGPRRIAVDHELLGRLRADSSRAEWLTLTRRAGLGEVRPDEGGLPLAADLVRALGRLLGAVGEAAARYRYAELLQQFLGLVFVDIHGETSLRQSRSFSPPPCGEG